MIKKLLFILAILAFFTGANAQDAYNEAIRKAKAAADNTSKTISERKIATFKKDALYYMGSMAYKLMPDSSVTMLDHQAIALFEFVNLYTNCLVKSPKKDHGQVMELFMNISLSHPKFHDPNKEYTLAYITNEGYLTKFSLDTDWVAAYAEARQRLQMK